MTRSALILPALALALFAAGCGGSDEPATTTAPAEQQQEQPAAAKTAGTVVEMTGSTFAPDSVDIKVGDTISFVNKDGVAHNATASGTFESGTLEQDAVFNYTADKAGTIDYVCTFHPGMTGTINVT